MAEISKAWGGQGSADEISVPGLDEDAFTLALNAAKDALENAAINADEVGMICINTVSHNKFPLAPRVAFGLGMRADARVHDFALSTRGTTQSILTCLDAVRAEFIRFGLVIGVEVPLPEPGSADEMSWGAAASALVIGDRDLALTVSGSSSYSSAFTERWTVASSPFRKETAFPRFGRDMGYVDHVFNASSTLFNLLNLKPEDLKLAIFQESASIDRAAKRLRIPQERLLRSQSGKFFGDTGSAALPLSLIEGSGKVESNDKLLMASYGIGGSDALCLVAQRPEKMRGAVRKLQAFWDKKNYIDYPTLLRHRRIIGYAG